MPSSSIAGAPGCKSRCPGARKKCNAARSWPSLCTNGAPIRAAANFCRHPSTAIPLPAVPNNSTSSSSCLTVWSGMAAYPATAMSAPARELYSSPKELLQWAATCTPLPKATMWNFCGSAPFNFEVSTPLIFTLTFLPRASTRLPRLFRLPAATSSSSAARMLRSSPRAAAALVVKNWSVSLRCVSNACRQAAWYEGWSCGLAGNSALPLDPGSRETSEPA